MKKTFNDIEIDIIIFNESSSILTASGFNFTFKFGNDFDNEKEVYWDFFNQN